MSNDPAHGPASGSTVPPEGTTPQPAVGWGGPPQQADQHDDAAPAASGWGPPPQEEPGQGWGGPPSGRPAGAAGVGSQWRGLSGPRKGLAAAAAAVVIAGGAGAAVWAATSATAGTGTAAGQGFGGSQGGPGGQGGQAGQNGAANGRGPGGQTGSRGGFGAAGMGLPGQMLHGEFVVVRDNANVTMVEQTGTVTAASGQSATVKSTDGFEQTYAVSPNTQIGSRAARGQAGAGSGSQSSTTLAQGQTVTVTALKDGLTAQTIIVTGAD